MILAAEDPLKPTISEAVLSFGPTVLMIVIFLLIVIYCAKAVKNKYSGNKNKQLEMETDNQGSDKRLFR